MHLVLNYIDYMFDSNWCFLYVSLYVYEHTFNKIKTYIVKKKKARI
jgi:hypothetical protein